MSRQKAWFWLLFHVVLGVLLAVIVSTSGKTMAVRTLYEGEIPKSDPVVTSYDLVKSQLPDQEWVGLIVRLGSTESRQGRVEQGTILRRDTLELVSSLTTKLEAVPKMAYGSVRSATNTQVLMPGDELATELIASPGDWSTEAGIAKIQTRLEANPLHAEMLVGHDQRSTLIGGYLEVGFDQLTVANAIRALATSAPAGVEILPIGNVIAQQEIEEGIDAQSNLLVGLAVLVMVVAFFWLRMPGAGIAMLFIKIVGILEITGVQILVGLPKSIVSTAAPLLFVALGVAYFYYFVREVQRWSGRIDERVKHALREMRYPMYMSAASCAIGFLTLWVGFDILSIREFGLLAGFGTLWIVVLARTLFPALMVLWPRLFFSEWVAFSTPLIVDVSESLLRFVMKSKRPWYVLGIFVLVTGFGLAKLEINTDPFNFFPRNHVVRRSLEALKPFGGNSELIIAIRPLGSPLTPTFLGRLYALEQRLKAIPSVGQVEGYASLAADIGRKVYAPKPLDPRNFPKSLPGLMDQFLDAKEANRVISEDHTTMFIHVWADAWSSADVARVINGLRTELAEFTATGYTDVAGTGLTTAPYVAIGGYDTLWVATNRYIAWGKLANIAIALILIGGLIWIFPGFRMTGWERTKRSLTIVGGMLLGVLGTLSVMGWAGVWLDLATCVITAVGIGIAGDFIIHLTYSLEGRQSIDDVHLKDLVVYCLLTAAGFAVFGLATFVPLKLFAWLVWFILASGLLAAVLVVSLTNAEKMNRRGFFESIVDHMRGEH